MFKFSIPHLTVGNPPDYVISYMRTDIDTDTTEGRPITNAKLFAILSTDFPHNTEPRLDFCRSLGAVSNNYFTIDGTIAVREFVAGDTIHYAFLYSPSLEGKDVLTALLRYNGNTVDVVSTGRAGTGSFKAAVVSLTGVTSMHLATTEELNKMLNLHLAQLDSNATVPQDGLSTYLDNPELVHAGKFNVLASVLKAVRNIAENGVGDVAVNFSTKQATIVTNSNTDPNQTTDVGGMHVKSSPAKDQATVSNIIEDITTAQRERSNNVMSYLREEIKNAPPNFRYGDLNTDEETEEGAIARRVKEIRESITKWNDPTVYGKLNYIIDQALENNAKHYRPTFFYNGLLFMSANCKATGRYWLIYDEVRISLDESVVHQYMHLGGLTNRLVNTEHTIDSLLLLAFSEDK